MCVCVESACVSVYCDFRSYRSQFRDGLVRDGDGKSAHTNTHTLAALANINNETCMNTHDGKTPPIDWEEEQRNPRANRRNIAAKLATQKRMRNIFLIAIINDFEIQTDA